MINTRDPKVQNAINGIHQAMEQKLLQAGGRANEQIVRESRILSILVQDPEAGPTDCARRMCAKYSDDLNADQVIRLFGSLAIRNPVERAMLMKWAVKVAAMFKGAISGNRKDMDAFNMARKDYVLKNMHDRRRGLHERVLAIALFEMYPELNTMGDKEHLQQLGNVYACFFLYDLVDAVCAAYGFPKFEKGTKAERTQRKDSGNGITIEQALEKIRQLEEALERTNLMLQDLQNEFNEQLENSKVIELTDFFAQLNSDKYGNILDQLLATRKGVESLRRSGFELPLEINGLLIMVAKLTQFVRDSHINPVVRTDAVLTVRASDIESYEYEGTPFVSRDEQKRVRVLSSGWIFKDKEVMISRPKVREVQE